MRVTVFGGSKAAEGSAAYAQARDLGRSLAAMGCTVLTGGYTGTMEAVSRGATEQGGHVVGVTCVDVERTFQRSVNGWVREEWKKPTLLERLETLIRNCDAAMALPGGPGTLTEIALTWNLMIVGGLTRRPLILIGNEWRRVWDEFFAELGEYIPARQRELVLFAADAAAAVRLLGSTQAPASRPVGTVPGDA
jgi:hypothetical protein